MAMSRTLRGAISAVALLIAAFSTPVSAADPNAASKAELMRLARDARYPQALVIAQKLANEANAAGRKESKDYAEAVSWLAFLHQAQGEMVLAGPYFREAAEIYGRVTSGNDPDYATSLNNLGFYYCLIGDNAQAEALYQRALEMREATLPKNHPQIADTLNNLAELYQSQERNEEVVPLLNRALEIRTHSLAPNDPLIASSLQNLAGAYELDPEHYSFAAAQKLLEKALAIQRISQRPDHPEIAGTISKLAGNLFNQGKYAEAEKRFREALDLRLASQPPNHPNVASTLIGLARTEMERGNPKEAETLLLRTLDIRRQVFAPNAEQFAESYRYLGRAQMLQGKTGDALASMRKATANVLARSERKGKEVELLTDHLQILAAADSLPGADRTRDLDEGFTVGQNAEQSETAKAVSGMAARFAAQDPKLQDLVGKMQTLEATQKVIERHLISELAKPPEMREKGLRQELDKTEKERLAIQAQVKAQFPEYFELVNANALSVSDTQRLIRDDEALITIVSGLDRTYVWALTKDKSAWSSVSMQKSWLQDSIKRLRTSLDTEDLKENVGKPGALFDLGLSYDLYSKLLAPLESTFADKHKLIIVPSGPLTSLPFHVLVTKQPKIQHPVLGDLPVYRDTAWIIRDHALTVLPSVGSLRALRTLPQRAENRRPMIGFGNPKFGQLGAPGTSRGTVRVADASNSWSLPPTSVRAILSGLPELPGAEQELKTVAKDLGASDADIFLGSAATEKAVKKADLRNYNVVYFATHGLVADDIKGLNEPALVMTPPDDPNDGDDGLLTASEVSQLSMNADWVVLAACNTAAESKPGARALSGLAKAFFHAGARALLVSHWRVDSEAAAALTTLTFDIKSKNPQIGRAEALREAMLQRITKAPEQPAQVWDAYPAFWAAFSVVGEGG